MVLVPNIIPDVLQLVFAAFDGEAWGYLGSRKFLQELDEGDDSVNGINSSMIEQVSTWFDGTGNCIVKL